LSSGLSTNTGNIRHIYYTGFTVLAVSIFIVIALFASGQGSLISSPITTISGVSIYAIFYLMAQFIERLAEPVSNTPWFGGHDDPTEDNPQQKKNYSGSLDSLNKTTKEEFLRLLTTEKVNIADPRMKQFMESTAPRMEQLPDSLTGGKSAADRKQWLDSLSKALSDNEKTTVASLKQARAISLWAYSSGLGILLCYLTIGLFQVTGIISGTSLASHLGDSIISGIIIGGGTKPLHDLINLFDTAGSK
jgi:hypothetical protein